MANFPHTKRFDAFDFADQPSLNKPLVLALTHGEWIEQRRNVIALGPSGTGKTHAALAHRCKSTSLGNGRKVPDPVIRASRLADE